MPKDPSQTHAGGSSTPRDTIDSLSLDGHTEIIDATDSATPGDPQQDPPVNVNLNDFYPPEIVKLLASPELEQLGVYPIIAWQPKLRRKQCGTAVATPLAHPLPGIAKIRCVKQDNTNLFGSAFLITPQCLLTAGHNLWPKTTVRKVFVTLPGAATVEAARFQVSTQWAANANGTRQQDRDYGVIFLSTPADSNNVICPKIVDSSALFQNFDANMAGYPQEAVALHAGRSQFSVNRFGNLIGYQINSCPGQSGAPVYILMNGRYVAVAVQAYGQFPRVPNFSMGPLVDTVMRGELMQWIGHDVCV